MRKLFLTTLLFVAAIFGVVAQGYTPIHVDKNVRMGKLDNGLTYYIRHNEQPKERCEFHIAQAVGAILEEDHQNGLAHFLEHMAFNGTKNFPDKLLINYFESVGVNFGGNINAYTSLDETVYRLSDVPTRESVLDSALLVMHDWSCAIALQAEEIDNERGVIREEWRTGNNFQRRMWREINKKAFPGSQYAKRDVIGDTAVINNFTYQALRDYYHKWYGPDLQSIVIVGDIDVDVMEAKLKKLFNGVPARANRGERPRYGILDNKEPIVARYVDKEAQYSLAQIYFKHEAFPRQLKETQEGYMVVVLNSIIDKIIGYRFEDMTLDPNANFIQAAGGYGNMAGTTDAFQFQMVPKDGKEIDALRDVLTEIERINRYGFTNAEVERAKTELYSDYEKYYNDRGARTNISYAREYYRHFLDGDPIPGIEWEFDYVKQVLPFITADMVSQVAKDYVTEENVVVTYGGKEAIPTEDEIIRTYKEVKVSEIEAPVEEIINAPLVDMTPKKGKIKKEKTNDVYGTTEWTLSNGMRVVIKPTKFNENEIRFTAYSKGGLSKVAVEDLPSAEFATSVISFNGYGNHDAKTLQRILTGKNVNVSASINAYSEDLDGSATVKDFETMLQLIYLQFTGLRADDEAFKTLMSMVESQISSRDKNPKTAYSDSIQMMSTQHHERTLILNTEFLKRVDQNRALEIAEDRFSRPADFTFVFVGNIDPADPIVREQIATWLGGIKGKKKTEKMVDNGIRYPKGVVKNYFSREMSTHTASNRIMYTGEMDFNLANRLNMNVIGTILSTRYLESIREREGGSYGVGVYGGMQRFPVEMAYLLMDFDTDPEKQEKLMGIIHDEVKQIVENGPRADDLQKAKESLLKDFGENVEKNGYWIGELHNVYNLGAGNYVGYTDAVNAVTAETIQKTLKALVEQGNMFEVVMMPETK